MPSAEQERSLETNVDMACSVSRTCLPPSYEDPTRRVQAHHVFLSRSRGNPTAAAATCTSEMEGDGEVENPVWPVLLFTWQSGRRHGTDELQTHGSTALHYRQIETP